MRTRHVINCGCPKCTKPKAPSGVDSLKATMLGAVTTAQRFVLNPKTKRFASAGGKALELAAQLGQAKLKGPLGIIGVAVGAMNVMSNHTKEDNNGIYQTIIDIADQRGLKAVKAYGAIELLYEQGVFKNAEVLIENKELSFKLLRHDGHEVAIVELVKEAVMLPWFDAFISSKTIIPALVENLWRRIGDAITLSYRQNVRGQEVLTATSIIGFDSNEYGGSTNDPGVLLAKFRKYQQAGISKAYMAVGPPGTGKTTYCYRMSKLMGGRLLVITPDILVRENMSQHEIIDLIGTFIPNVLVFEDVDRVTNTGLLLSMVDFIRKTSPQTLVISTANDRSNIVEALRRPGRLGAEIVFDSPGVEHRRQIIRLYCVKFGITRDLTHLAESMDHSKFSHDYIKEVCEQALVEDDETLHRYIRTTIESFGTDAAAADSKRIVKEAASNGLLRVNVYRAP